MHGVRLLCGGAGSVLCNGTLRDGVLRSGALHIGIWRSGLPGSRALRLGSPLRVALCASARRRSLRRRLFLLREIADSLGRGLLFQNDRLMKNDQPLLYPHMQKKSKQSTVHDKSSAVECLQGKEETEMREKLEHRIDTPIREVEDLASATECTGLIPAGVQTQAEAENYAELYAIHEQKPAWKKETNGKPQPRKED